MSAAAILAVAAVCVAAATALFVIGGRKLSAARGVDRVQVPARLLRRSRVVNGQVLDVEYPAPDGSALRAQLFMWFVHAPGVPYAFDGTVWVNRVDPRDVTPRKVGRATTAIVTLILGGVCTVTAFGAGIAAAIVAFSQSMTVVG